MGDSIKKCLMNDLYTIQVNKNYEYFEKFRKKRKKIINLRS